MVLRQAGTFHGSLLIAALTYLPQRGLCTCLSLHLVGDKCAKSVYILYIYSIKQRCVVIGYIALSETAVPLLVKLSDVNQRDDWVSV